MTGGAWALESRPGFLCRRGPRSLPTGHSDAASGPGPALTASRRAPPGILNARPTALPFPEATDPGDTELRSVLLVILAAPPPLFLRPSTSGGRGLTETRVLSDPPPAPFSLWGFFRDSGPPQGASPAFGLRWVSASIVPACAQSSGNGLRAPVPAIPSRLSHSPVSPRDYGV